MQKQKIISIFFALSLLIHPSCGDEPLEKRYDPKTRQADLKQMKLDGEITNEQFVELGIFFAHASFNKINLTGKTYKDLIKEAHDFKMTQKEERVELTGPEKEKYDQLKRLQNVVSLELLGKENTRDALGKAVDLKLKWKNHSECDIIRISGTIGFIDIYGKVFSELKVDFKDSLFVGSEKEWVVQKSLFKESDYLYSKTIEYIKINWTPEKFIFSDKTVFSLNPEPVKKK
ncbi:MAG: hypothetical protein IPM56_07965 [Ignavibacteriales bacterium]|nr:MAG: hypothetical protein IPM56_07965 [Ignavibacteriales bacterium]